MQDPNRIIIQLLIITNVSIRELPSSSGVTILVNIDRVAMEPAPCIISTNGPGQIMFMYNIYF